MNIEHLKDKLKRQRNVGVSRSGTLVEDPHNDGSRETRAGLTTLKNERSYSK